MHSSRQRHWHSKDTETCTLSDTYHPVDVIKYARQCPSLNICFYCSVFLCLQGKRLHTNEKVSPAVAKRTKSILWWKKIFTLGDLVFIFLLHLCWPTQIYLLSNIFALKNVLARYLKSTTNLFFYVQCDGECSTRLA